MRVFIKILKNLFTFNLPLKKFHFCGSMILFNLSLDESKVFVWSHNEFFFLISTTNQNYTIDSKFFKPTPYCASLPMTYVSILSQDQILWTRKHTSLTTFFHLRVIKRKKIFFSIFYWHFKRKLLLLLLLNIQHKLSSLERRK